MEAALVGGVPAVSDSKLADAPGGRPVMPLDEGSYAALLRFTMRRDV